ncbi:hypothetical protein BLS_002302 [Venturia inaequalis]|uniref:Uncharacterized protein n=1 Tax=Venturia inaequalis TaxID=5025 RepID=A0A8H3YIC2_VENIN|nr:hypothetical protein BLS_002302 [Venturia inaequalis]KAE9963643.1 hypothetical protein EG328_011241 [Venturia inaequalis]
MHFTTTTVLALMSVFTVMASPVDNMERDTNKALNVGWKEGPAGNINKDALKDCVRNFGSWSSESYCGGAKWNLGGSNYASSNDCKNACREGMNARIDRGLTSVTCDDWEGVAAHCWFMYWT